MYIHICIGSTEMKVAMVDSFSIQTFYKNLYIAFQFLYSNIVEPQFFNNIDSSNSCHNFIGFFIPHIKLMTLRQDKNEWFSTVLYAFYKSRVLVCTHKVIYILYFSKRSTHICLCV